MKRVLSCLLLLGAFLSVRAGEPSAFLNRISDLLTRPNARLDTNYISFPTRHWMVSVRNDLFRTGTSIDMRDDVEYSNDWEPLKYGTRTSLSIPLADKVSIFASYGSLRLGYGFVISGKNSVKSNSLSLLKPTFGINVQYYKISGLPTGEVTVYDEDQAASGQLISTLPAVLRTVSADTYYAFNNKRYIYNATYTAYNLQKRSAGSFLLTGKYQFGGLDLPLDDYSLIALNHMVGKYRTHQFSFGFGYGFNWVPLHRSATGGDDSTLRNFTANITLVPMVVVSNRMFYTSYDSVGEEESVPVAVKTTRLWGGMGFDMIARCALCYSFGRYSVGANFTYNRFRMVGSQRLASVDSEFDDDGVEQEYFLFEDVELTNRFFDWSASLRFDVRF